MAGVDAVGGFFTTTIMARYHNTSALEDYVCAWAICRSAAKIFEAHFLSRDSIHGVSAKSTIVSAPSPEWSTR